MKCCSVTTGQCYFTKENYQPDCFYSHTGLSCCYYTTALQVLNFTACTAQHCTALHYTILPCTELHYTARLCTLYCIIKTLHCTVLYCITLHRTTLYYTALRCTSLHCITLDWITRGRLTVGWGSSSEKVGHMRYIYFSL